MPVESNYALERILALKQAAKQAMGGFGTGLKNQAQSIAQMLGNPLQTLGGALEGAHSMALNSRPAEQAMRQYLAQSLSSPQGMGQLAGENIGPGELVKALMGAKALGGIGAMTAYHGSPHKFDKFDSSKIGTGEGAQAYGHGLYFAEDPSVANHYKLQMQGNLDNTFDFDGSRVELGSSQVNAQAALQAIMRGDRGQAEELLNDWKRQADYSKSRGWSTAIYDPDIEVVERALNAKSVKPSSGHLYNVDIPDEAINKMLDWDGKMGDQPESVRAILESIDDPMFKAWQSNGAWPHIDGQAIYSHLAGGMTNGSAASGKHAAASAKLRELGIPGIKYLDAGSRQSGKGTRNFVVFDDSILKILNRE